MLPKYVTRVETIRDELNIYVKSDSIENVMMFLRDHTSCQFRQMVDMTAVDYPTRPERFELSYMLLSHRYNYRLRVKTAVDELTAVETTSFVHPAANWCVVIHSVRGQSVSHASVFRSVFHSHSGSSASASICSVYALPTTLICDGTLFALYLLSETVADPPASQNFD